MRNLLPLVLAVLLGSLFGIGSGQPQGGVEPTPACNAQPKDFTAPTFDCGGGLTNLDCAKLCADAYKAAAAAAVNARCQKGIDCDAGYWSCLSNGGTIAECTTEKAMCEAQGDGELDAALDAATASFFDCAADCCAH